jgi:hypothetical protein
MLLRLGYRCIFARAQCNNLSHGISNVVVRMEARDDKGVHTPLSFEPVTALGCSRKLFYVVVTEDTTGGLDDASS